MIKFFELRLFFISTFFVFASCEEKKIEIPKKTYKGGVILSFDDAFIDQWYDTNQKLEKYPWKGTFFVCKINTLNYLEIQKLLAMQKQGHEIAGHTYNHINAVQFLKNNSVEKYVKQEIDPMLQLMDFYGLNVSTFAYPYGARTEPLDKALLQKFKIIRGRAFCEDVADKQGCFYNNSNLVFSFSIDDTHNHFTIPHLLELLEFTKKNNKILILNSHITVENVTGDFQTKNKTLEFVCEYVKNNNLNFYTMSDLQKSQ